MDARTYLHSWNRPVRERLSRAKIEEDIRDALQSVRTVQPTADQRKTLLELSAKVGVHYAFLGFPAASRREAELCTALVEHVATRGLTPEPVFMARAVEADVLAIVDIRDRTGFDVTADIFIGTSALRFEVEGWTLEETLGKLRRAARFAAANGLGFRISLEDSSRTAPAELARAVREAVDLGAKAIILCDTVGDCLPSGAAHHTAFVMELIDRTGAAVEVGWHGHNDKGLGLANALAAVEAGAGIVSGTFLGVGERTGNVPLEQMILILHEAGNGMYDLRYLEELCRTFSISAGIEMPPNLPVVGKDAFSTSTGTHAAAILKARRMGRDFEDLMYSAVRAGSLGRKQTLLVGPNSGRGAVRAALEDLAIPPTEETISLLLRLCKEQDRCLESAEEILALLGPSRRPRFGEAGS